MSALIRRLPNLTRQFARNTSAKAPIPPGYREGINPDLTQLKKFQAQMQVDDGVPVYLKRGKTDYILFYFATAIVVYCTGHSAYVLYNLTTK